MHITLELYAPSYNPKPPYVKCSAVVNINNDDSETSK